MKAEELNHDKLHRLAKEVKESKDRHGKAVKAMETATEEVKNAVESLASAQDAFDEYMIKGDEKNAVGKK